MTMLAQEAKQLLRPPLEQRLLTPIQFLRGIPAWNSHRLLLAFCVYGGADHTLGIEVDPEVVTDRNDLVFEPIGALAPTIDGRRARPRGGPRRRLVPRRGSAWPARCAGRRSAPRPGTRARSRRWSDLRASGA